MAKEEQIIEKKTQGQKTSLQKFGYLLAFLIPMIVMNVVLYLEKAAPFGTRSFLYADAHDQYYSVFCEMIRFFHGDGQGLFMWDRGLGADLFTNILYYGMSLFNLPILLLGEEYLEITMTYVIILKMAVMGVTSYGYFMHSARFRGEKKNGWFHVGLSLAASQAMCMCSFILAYGNNMMWLDGLLLLPILALAMEKMVAEGKWKLYTICLCLAMVSNFYFSVYICFFCFLFFLLLEFKEKGRFIKSFIRFAWSSVIAALLAGAVLVPAFIGIMGRGNYDASYYISQIPAFGDLFRFLESFNFGSELDGMGASMFAANNYCGCLVLFMLIMFLTEKKQSFGYKAKHLIVFLGLAAVMNVKVLGYIMHGFAYPHGMGNRFAFILIFLLIMTAFETASQLEQPSMGRVLISSLVLLGVLIIGMLNNPENSYMYTMIGMIIISILALLLVRKSIKQNTFRVWIVSLWIVEIVANCCMVAPIKSVDHSLMDEIKYDTYKDAYADLQTAPGERKTALINKDFMALSNVNWYSSMLNGNMSDVFQSMGLSNYEVAEVTYRGTTPLTALLFNVRYAMTNEKNIFGGYHVVEDKSVKDQDGGELLDVYEADVLAGMGFMVSDEVLDWKGNESVADNQNAFWEKALGVNESKLFTVPKMKYLKSTLMLMETVTQTEDSIEYFAPSDFPPIMTFYYEMEEDADLYFWVEDTNPHIISAYVDDEIVTKSLYTDSATTGHIGEVHSGQIVQIQMSCSSVAKTKGFTHWQLMAFRKDCFEENISEITDEILVTDLIEKNTLSGHIEAKKDGVMYIALPYQKGYDVKIDGTSTETLKIGTGLMGVKMTAGSHKVEISYHTPGVKTGWILTIAGILMFAITCFIGFRGQKPTSLKGDVQL